MAIRRVGVVPGTKTEVQRFSKKVAMVVVVGWLLFFGLSWIGSGGGVEVFRCGDGGSGGWKVVWRGEELGWYIFGCM